MILNLKLVKMAVVIWSQRLGSSEREYANRIFFSLAIHTSNENNNFPGPRYQRVYSLQENMVTDG